MYLSIREEIQSLRSGDCDSNASGDGELYAWPGVLIALSADLCGVCHFRFWPAAGGFDDTRRIVLFKLGRTGST
jgi:hypothetical protein